MTFIVYIAYAQRMFSVYTKTQKSCETWPLRFKNILLKTPNSMKDRTLIKIVGCLCSAIILAFFVGAYCKMPYEFYLTMRWALLALFGTCAFVSKANKWVCAVFVLWAVVYNPIGRPFPIPRHTWELINVATLAWLLFWLGRYVFSKKDEEAQEKLEEAQEKLEQEELKESAKTTFGDMKQKIKSLHDELYATRRKLSQAEQNLAWSQVQNNTLQQQITNQPKTQSLVVQLQAENSTLKSENTRLKKQLFDANKDLTDALKFWSEAEKKMVLLQDAIGEAESEWDKFCNWLSQTNKNTVIGQKYEIHVAKELEKQSCTDRVDWVGNAQWDYDLVWHQKNGSKVFVECKCWSKHSPLSSSTLDRFVNFLAANPDTKGLLFTTSKLIPADKARIERWGGVVREDQDFPPNNMELVRAFNKRYYIPTDIAYSTFRKSDNAKYFSTTFEAVLAGYER